jgi:hypothetical protein
MLGSAYLRVEYLSHRYGEQFGEVTKVIANEYAQGETEYLKVFNYSAKSAKIFMVIKADDRLAKEQMKVYDGRKIRFGCFYPVEREDPSGTWRLHDRSDEDCVWSESGSADGSTWPPYH